MQMTGSCLSPISTRRHILCVSHHAHQNWIFWQGSQSRKVLSMFTSSHTEKAVLLLVYAWAMSTDQKNSFNSLYTAERSSSNHLYASLHTLCIHSLASLYHWWIPINHASHRKVAQNWISANLAVTCLMPSATIEYSMFSLSQLVLSMWCLQGVCLVSHMLLVCHRSKTIASRCLNVFWLLKPFVWSYQEWRPECLFERNDCCRTSTLSLIPQQVDSV